jgi:hypothetical protein
MNDREEIPATGRELQRRAKVCRWLSGQKTPGFTIAERKNVTSATNSYRFLT